MFPPDSDLSLLSEPHNRRAWLRRFALPALALASIPRAEAFEWQVVQEDGRDYVKLEDIKTFYKFPRLLREGRNAWLRSNTMIIKFSTSAEDIFINNVKFCLSFPTSEKNGSVLVSRVDLAKLLDPIIRPTYIENAQGFDTVVIDAGHGGHDSGAVGSYGAEKAYTLDTALRLEKKLKELGYKTLLTRRSDVFLTLGERVAIANRTPRSIFVSVHYNSYSSSSAIGLETFALAPQGTATTYDALKSSDMANRRGNARDSENIALATAVHANTLYKLRSVDRGVKRARYSVISGIEKPGILVEGGFVSSPSEGARIHRPDFRQSLAESIAGGIGNFRRALMKRSSVPQRSAP
ncbi:MAG: n-acetylmuramoyl-l-alanine amidase [Verrucomicrobiales bacterium]|nr:n-acetylmuramoyl-l-alanine amidase [Verrucomicrobiales bacterium]